MNEDPINTRYTEGVAEIDGFSEKYYVSEGTDGGPKFDHTSHALRVQQRSSQETMRACR